MSDTAAELEPKAEPTDGSSPQTKPILSRLRLFSILRRESRSRLSYSSKDYVEHLRTVHFALLSVSAGLLLLILSAKPYDSRKALMQIDGILRLKSKWSPHWIIDQITRKEPTSGVIAPKDLSDVIRWGVVTERSSVVPYIPFCDLPEDKCRQSVLIKLTGQGSARPTLIKLTPPTPNRFHWRGGKHDLDEVPDRLDDFTAWWKQLGAGNNVFAQVGGTISSICICRGCSDKTCELIDNSDGKVPDSAISTSDPAGILYYDAPQKGVKDEQYSVALIAMLPGQGHVIWTGAPHYIETGVPVYAIFGVSQNDVRDLFPESGTGDFSKSFTDLDRATMGIQSLELARVAAYLQANSNSSEVFEAFGLKIRADQVTSWGTVVILSIQLYLLVYLQGLKRPLEQTDDAWDVGWFAVNQAILPRSIFFVTVWILPVVTVGLLAKHALDRRLQQVPFHWEGVFAFAKEPFRLIHDSGAAPFTILSCCLAFGLGYLNWSNRPRIKFETAQVRNQLLSS